jgi:transposase
VTVDFIWRMEDILELYAQPYDPQRPVIGFDERPYQLRANRRAPLPMAPGRVRRIDYEYERKGTCNLFMMFEPLRGWRHVEVTQQRTNQDFAHCMQAVVNGYFPDADVIRVVLDNLSTHTPAALYQAFEPAEARRIARKLEFHYTPKHGSWLNMTEIELSVLERQCLRRRLGDIPTTQREVAAWEHTRNRAKATVHWRFATEDARTKFKRLYSKNHCG